MILKWYKDAHAPKGWTVFMDQMKKFVEWLEQAESGERASGYLVWNSLIVLDRLECWNGRLDRSKDCGGRGARCVRACWGRCAGRGAPIPGCRYSSNPAPGLGDLAPRGRRLRPGAVRGLGRGVQEGAAGRAEGGLEGRWGGPPGGGDG